MTNRSSFGPGRGTAHARENRKETRGSSTRWLERQLNDPYVRAAKAKGYQQPRGVQDY